MAILALLILQATLPTQPFDLRNIVWEPPCSPTTGDEIVVCGNRREEKYRLPSPPGEFGDKPPMAQIGVLGDGSAKVETEAYALPGGATSNRVMLRITKPF